MPQMSPSLWILIMIYITLNYLLSMILSYFFHILIKSGSFLFKKIKDLPMMKW